MIKIRGIGSVSNPSVSDGEVVATLSVDISVPADLPQALRADAEMRIAMLLRQEAQRCAEIAFVDALDAKAEPAELARIRAADPNRSHVIVSPGTREAVLSGQLHPSEAVQVLRGEIEVAGHIVKERGAL